MWNNNDKNMTDKTKDAVDATKDAASHAYNKTEEATSNAADATKNGANGAYEATIDAVGGAYDKTKQVACDAFDATKDAVGGVYDNITGNNEPDPMKDIADAAVKTTDAAKEKAKGAKQAMDKKAKIVQKAFEENEALEQQ
jgi:hypothetical protein